MNWLSIVSVFIGSGLGGVCRYLLSRVVQTALAPSSFFPWGTLLVNVLGCFLIGLFYGISDRYSAPDFFSPQIRLLLTVGFCGGFTTFSTFINENYLLFQSSNMLSVLGYMAFSIVIGFIFLYTGYAVSHVIK